MTTVTLETKPLTLHPWLLAWFALMGVFLLIGHRIRASRYSGMAW